MHRQADSSPRESARTLGEMRHRRGKKKGRRKENGNKTKTKTRFSNTRPWRPQSSSGTAAGSLTLRRHMMEECDLGDNWGDGPTGVSLFRT